MYFQQDGAVPNRPMSISSLFCGKATGSLSGGLFDSGATLDFPGRCTVMGLGLVFWIIMLVVLLGGGWYYRTQPFFPGFGVFWLLLAILGWKVFGPGIVG